MARRRHRVFIVLAVAIVLLLYHLLATSCHVQQPSPVGVKRPQPQAKLPASYQLDDTPVAAAEGQTTSHPSPDPTKLRWTKPKQHFPLAKENIITLPTGIAKSIPRIQHVFPPEAEGPRQKRLKRQAMVKEEIQRSWAGYRKHAWMHDELLPVSNGSRDPFCGWAATLVDSLDTLWIAGLRDEFDEAAKAVQTIDFTFTHSRNIPVFETTIRYLGGLIAAYDVSGGASGGYSFLLDKATELAEVLMGIFDTPNRMPVLYYAWMPENTSQPHQATRAGMAELATLSMEFTRLAQLTSQHKYYDAIDRITNGLIELQKTGTKLPGLFPENLDISGCNRTPTMQRDAMSKAAKDRVGSEVPSQRSPRGHDEGEGFVPGDDLGAESYHMGGGQDSAYEYFGKEYLLLGGRETKYQKLYEDAIESINKHLLFRPMVQGDWDIVFPAKVTLNSSGASIRVEYEVTHLTCFIGGMYALGGKLFGRERDVEYAKRLTDGCVWAYQSTATGLMPEKGLVVPCPTAEQCSFDEVLWWQQLDPIYHRRGEEVLAWEAREAERERLNEQEDSSQMSQTGNDNLASSRKLLGEADDDGSAQHQSRSSGKKRAAISGEPENVDRSSNRLSKRKPSSEPSIKSPTPKEEHHSRPKAPNIPPNQPNRSRYTSKPLTHKEFVQREIQRGIPPGYSSVSNTKYILRPEAIESVWYMYRITGDSSWMEKGWAMFEATMEATRTARANSAVDNVLRKEHVRLDEMESFWLAETLKYYYLLFSGPDVISLDEWVLNTEAHPFKL
ncbi:hypothetical protein ED733_007733 [Metarhizium rileyi]|uniref:alpha-1,2-Mannosidase n=1 Tax=Metarhizium rileyi (strain RCEF 4871) TaxID=1649241 RepID=A0A5C6GK77_METRR|nr:hypothetical protein ED733_007733 [Metarhizium rileyi]